MSNRLKLQITKIEDALVEGDYVIHFELYEGSPDPCSIDHDLESMGITGDSYSYVYKWFPDSNTGIIKQQENEKGCCFSIGDELTVGSDLTPISNAGLHVQTTVFERRLKHLVSYLMKQQTINENVKDLLLDPSSLNRLLIDELGTPNSIQEFAHYITSNPLIYAAAIKEALAMIEPVLSDIQRLDLIKREQGYSLYKLVFLDEDNNESAWLWSRGNPSDMVAYLQFTLESLADYEQVDITIDAVPMANALIKLYDCHYAVPSNNYETVVLHDVREERCGQWYSDNFLQLSRFTRDKYQVLSALGPHILDVSY